MTTYRPGDLGYQAAAEHWRVQTKQAIPYEVHGHVPRPAARGGELLADQAGGGIPRHPLDRPRAQQGQG